MPPDHNINDRRLINAEMVRLLHERAVLPILMAISVVGITWWVLRDWLPARDQIIWLVGMLTGYGLRLTEIGLYRRWGERLASPAFWKQTRIGLSLVVAALWASMALWIDTRWPTEMVIFLLWVLGGMTAGAAITLAGFPLAVASFALIALGLPVAKLLLLDLPLSQPVALLVTTFVVMVIGMAYSQSRTLRQSIAIRHSHASAVAQLSVSGQQLTEQLNAQAREQAVFSEGPVVAFRCADEAGLPIEYISPNCHRFGLDPNSIEAQRLPLARVVHPRDMVRLLSELRPSDGSALTPASQDLRLATGAGVPVWVHCYIVPLVNPEQNTVAFSGYFLDIAGRRRAEDALLREKERAEITLKSIGDAVITVDGKADIEYMNAVAETLTGKTLNAARNRSASSTLKLTEEDGRTRLDNPLISCIRNPELKEISQNAVLHRADGVRFDVALTAAPIRTSSGRLLGAVLVLHDMTEVRSMSRELNYFATHDPLTDLINRREFETALERAKAQVHEQDRTHVLAYIDLDQFKIVNDTCGHRAGDDLLQQVAGVLRAQLRPDDTLARLGGDEFGAIFADISIQDGAVLARKLLDSLVETRFGWEGRPFDIGASIGIVGLDTNINDVQDLLAAADMACYTAKEAGRNRVQIYTPSDADMLRHHRQMEWVARLRSALEEDRFLLFQQPIEPTDREEMQGLQHFEVLLRMLDQDGNIISVTRFLDAAERFNLMGEIDRWVVRKALKTLASESAVPGVTLCSVNLSGASLGDHAFGHFVQTELEQSSVDGRCICFEITETTAIQNLDAASAFIHQMQALGCRFALDDFGSGLSSFAYLKHMPVDFLKIDGVFVKDLLDDPVDGAMVAAINEIGHTLGIKTVAEYVQSEGIRDALIPLGVDFVQGDAIGKPTPYSAKPKLKLTAL